MYGALWRALPGGTASKALISALLFLVVVAVLFLWVFPWAENHLPFLEVTVGQWACWSRRVRDYCQCSGLASAAKTWEGL
jgi:hypothetical protein